jgi:hypothetical protein
MLTYADAVLRSFFAQHLQNHTTPSYASAAATKKKGAGVKDKAVSVPVLYPPNCTHTPPPPPAAPHTHAVAQTEGNTFYAAVRGVPEEVELVVVNPAASGARAGIRVLQLLRPFLQGRILCRMEVQKKKKQGAFGEEELEEEVRVWRLQTRNIRRFALEEIKGALLSHPTVGLAGGIIVDGILTYADVC